MNPLKKVYCRIFQTGFKLAIPFLPYRRPEKIETISDLPMILKKEHCDHVMVVTDQGIVKLGLHKAIVDALTKQDIKVTIYDGTSVNPTTENVKEAAQRYQEEKCQGIIGLGGGSALDCAKALGVVLVKKKPLSKMKGVLKVRKKLPLLIAIPTTAGTGSECTIAAVITDPYGKTKYAISDFPLIPKYALLDAEMTLTLPPFLTATTGMDALTHAIEAYIGNSTTNDTREASLKAITLIYQNLKEAYDDGKNQIARQNMADAAYLAGLAFTKSYVGYVHALAHALGGQYGTAHGYANAVLLPVVLRAYGSKIHQKLKDCAIAADLVSGEEDAGVASEKMISSIEEMNRYFKIGTTFKELKKEDIRSLAEHAEKEANPLYPVPVLMDQEDLMGLYEKVMEEI